MHHCRKHVGIRIPFDATVVLKLNDQHKIVHHMDLWGGSPLLHANDGFLGQLAEARRRLTGMMQETFVKLTGGTSIGSNFTAQSAPPK
jgi:hypothetical protein